MTTTKMTKKMYEDYKVFYKGNLNAKNATFDYKKEFKTIKNYKDFLKLKEYQICSKKQIRASVKEKSEHLSMRERLDARKKELFTNELNIIVNTNDGARVINSGAFSFEINEYADWDYYAKSYRFPKNFKTSVFNINLSNFKYNYRKYIAIDGIVNAEIKQITEKEDYILIEAVSILRKKIDGKIKFTLVPMFIAENEKYSYHSEKSFAIAIKGLERKAKTDIENVKKDTLITISMYKKITGACSAGINNWLHKHEFNSKIKIKADKLLSILKEENAYGWQKLERLIFKVS